MTKTIQKYFNDEGGLYHIVIETDNNGKFLKEFWKTVSTNCVPLNEKDACREWTDRSKDLRSKVQLDSELQKHLIHIFTHGWVTQHDKNELHIDVINFLKSRNLSIVQDVIKEDVIVEDPNCLLYVKVGDKDGNNGFIDLHSAIDYLNHCEIKGPIRKRNKTIFKKENQTITMFWGKPSDTPEFTRELSKTEVQAINLAITD